jgi:hypothetical protein
MLGVRWFPVTVGQIMWSTGFVLAFATKLSEVPLATGAFFLFIATPLIPIWPSRITIRFGATIREEREPEVLYRRVEIEIGALLREWHRAGRTSHRTG